MSVWAQSWAYEQRLGKWRENKNGDEVWKGDSGAKAVLAAAATFADENGYLFAGQDTLAEMCDMTERTVREHLYNLEHGYKKIRRKGRRGKDGGYTSDGIWILAPKGRLRPPRSSDKKDDSPPAEEFSVGEKRTHQRKSFPPPAEEFSAKPSVEPSVEPSDPTGGEQSPRTEKLGEPGETENGRTRQQELTDDLCRRVLEKHNVRLARRQYSFHLGGFSEMLKRDNPTDQELERVVAHMADALPRYPKLSPGEALQDVRFGRDGNRGKSSDHATPDDSKKAAAEERQRQIRGIGVPRKKSKVPEGYGRLVPDEGIPGREVGQ